MPNLERRYVPTDRGQYSAWLYGVLDAIEFMQAGHKYNSHHEGWFEVNLSQLVEDVSNYADEYWKDEFANVEGRDPVSLPEGRSGSDSNEEASAPSGSTGTRKDAGSPKQFGRTRSSEPYRQPRHIDSHPASQRKKRLDPFDRAVRGTEISRSGCAGSGHWYIDEEGNLIGACTCIIDYCANNRRSKP